MNNKVYQNKQQEALCWLNDRLVLPIYRKGLDKWIEELKKSKNRTSSAEYFYDEFCAEELKKIKQAGLAIWVRKGGHKQYLQMYLTEVGKSWFNEKFGVYTPTQEELQKEALQQLNEEKALKKQEATQRLQMSQLSLF